MPKIGLKEVTIFVVPESSIFCFSLHGAHLVLYNLVNPSKQNYLPPYFFLLLLLLVPPQGSCYLGAGLGAILAQELVTEWVFTFWTIFLVIHFTFQSCRQVLWNQSKKVLRVLSQCHQTQKLLLKKVFLLHHFEDVRSWIGNLKILKKNKRKRTFNV